MLRDRDALLKISWLGVADIALLERTLPKNLARTFFAGKFFLSLAIAQFLQLNSQIRYFI